MGVSFFNSPIGLLKIVSESGRLIGISHCDFCGNERPDEVTREAAKQLKCYFDGKLMRFELPITLNGSDFFRKVWESIAAVPYGKTITYGELASAAGNPKACRSAGSAAHNNPILIVVPCHRVVAKGGLGGFGLGLDAKRLLLEHEKATLMKFTR